MRILRALLVLVLAVSTGFTGASVAFADVDDATGENVKEGDNTGRTNQGGRSGSGDAVGGQVAGVVSGGRTSLDATNVSRNSSVESGDASGTNRAASVVGQVSGGSSRVAAAADISNSFAQSNLQEGDNALTFNQTANYSTGDGVAGQVIGAVTSPGGSASIVAANRSDDVDVRTGDAEGSNDAAAFVGQSDAFCGELVREGDALTCIAGPVIGADITNSEARANLQEGDNRLSARQLTSGLSGDGVAGQVIGAVSAGATSIDATNASSGVTVETGDVEANNNFAGLAGQNGSRCVLLVPFATCRVGPVLTADIEDSIASLNLQEGDNRATARQSATATSGDGVGGEVIGAVTSAGGAASIVAANTSRDSDVDTGDATSENGAATLAGQNRSLCAAFDAVAATCTVGPVLAADITGSRAQNLQEGDNRSTVGQTANAATGDGVAGQVIGSVSAGAASIDATNRSENVTVHTGEADATNGAATLVGQSASQCGLGLVAGPTTCTIGPVLTADISESSGQNLQEGDNTAATTQSATATSGDGVGGEVIGAVTLAGGSTSMVAANSSTDVDIDTGDATAANETTAFVGQDLLVCLATSPESCDVVPAPTTADITNVRGVNIQEGDNRLRAGQTARASTGDGVGGQVLGIVSAGATSVDATNRSDDVVASTGHADAANSLATFVGHRAELLDEDGAELADISGVNAPAGANVQEGDNSKSMTQTADASSGDAVGGQVLAGVTAGIITGAGGSVSVVVANTSEGIDASTGDAEFDNADSEFVGLRLATDIDI